MADWRDVRLEAGILVKEHITIIQVRYNKNLN